MPDWKDEIIKRLIELRLDPSREAEIVEELSQHLEDRYEEMLSTGVAQQEAIRRVLAELSDGQLLTQELRRVERLIKRDSVVPGAMRRNMMADLWQDLRYAARMLLNSPGFTLTAVITLALGIGANSAIFSLVDAVLLKELPVERPGQLFFIENVGIKGGGGAPPYPCFERFRDNTQCMSGVAAFSATDTRVSIDGQVEQVKGQFVSGNYFSLLGVQTVAGRALTPQDDSVIGTGGTDGPVAIIGYNYWQRRFARDPKVIGKVIQVANKPVTIIGVTPPEFTGMSPGRDVDINLPMMLADSGLITDKGSWWFDAVGRLRPGFSVEEARAEMDGIFQAFMDEKSPSRESRKDYFDHISLTAAGRGLNTLRDPYSRPLLILMAVVGFVLAVACANVANLLLARATARRKEFAVRLALGASRLRLVRQMLAEGLLLVGLGGLLSLLLALWGSRLLVNFFSTGRRQIFLNLGLDGRLLLFTVGLALLTGIVFSLAPALRAARIDPGPALKENAATASMNRSRMQMGKLLVIAQVALSLLLLVSAGLFLRSLQNLKNLDAGFRPEGVLTMRLDAEARNYQGPQLSSFWVETLARVRSLPGVVSASLSTLSPVDGRDMGIVIDVPGFAPVEKGDRGISINHVSPEYFATLGITVLQGRPFTDRDDESAPRVALLNERAARFYFGDRSPIGEKIRITTPRTADPCEIVGVVRDSRHMSLREEIPRLLYLPTLQPLRQLSRLTLAVLASGDPSALAGPIKNELLSSGPDILITNALTLGEQVDQSLLQERLVSSLSALFGGLALLLSCVGLYGVMSYLVARRTREIGIRMALGARSGDVLRMMLGEGMALVCIGLALGLIASVAATRVLASLLYGVSTTDPETFAAVSLLLAAAALVACYLPVRRATKLDPMVVLRYE